MPQGSQIFTEPFSDNPTYQGCSVRSGVPIIIISPSLLAFCIWSLCCAEAVQLVLVSF